MFFGTYRPQFLPSKGMQGRSGAWSKHVRRILAEVKLALPLRHARHASHVSARKAGSYKGVSVQTLASSAALGVWVAACDLLRTLPKMTVSSKPDAQCAEQGQSPPASTMPCCKRAASWLVSIMLLPLSSVTVLHYIMHSLL